MTEHEQEPLATRVRERTLDVGILLFAEVEILDFDGPYEVSRWRRASRRVSACWRIRPSACGPSPPTARRSAHAMACGSCPTWASPSQPSTTC